MQDITATSRPHIAIGVDTGGTHTDVVLVHGDQVATLKVPTTPQDLNIGILDGVRRICAQAGIDIEAVTRFVYATTYVTNLIVEEKDAGVALLTTEGFRDVLEIGRASRKPDVYDIHWRPAKPLVPRHLRFVAPERMDHLGNVLLPLDEEAVRAVMRELRARRVQSLAVCLLHAYVNPAHERRIASIAAEEYAELDVSLSSDVVREFREYERTSTTCVNAFIKRAIVEHLSALAQAAAQQGMAASCYVMRGNGGLSNFHRASELPAAITHSGVMGGIVGATALAAQCGISDIITLDMGGTSTDVALVIGGTPRMTHRSKVGAHPLLIPTLDMVTIGAGGGSVAVVQGTSALRVGPQSAGSVPGPACYGQGGERATVTDANIYTGRLNPAFFLAGTRQLQPERSEEVIRKTVAQPLGMETAQAAVGILSIAEAHMSNAIRLVSVDRGLDPRDFTLVAFGGAGALHAVRLAESLGIAKVLVPPAPGNLSAMGLLAADVRHDLARTLVALADSSAAGPVRELAAALMTQAREALAGENIAPANARFEVTADLRYKGQNYELNLPLVDADLHDDFVALKERFNALHQRMYGYCLHARPIQLVSIRVSAIGHIPKAAWPAHAQASREPAPVETRPVYIENAGWTDTRVYRFEDLAPGHQLEGPAIVEYPGSTLFLDVGWSARMDQFKNAHLLRSAGTKEKLP